MNYVAVTCLVLGGSVLTVTLIAWVVAVRRLYREELMINLQWWSEQEKEL